VIAVHEIYYFRSPVALFFFCQFVNTFQFSPWFVADIRVKTIWS